MVRVLPPSSSSTKEPPFVFSQGFDSITVLWESISGKTLDYLVQIVQFDDGTSNETIVGQIIVNGSNFVHDAGSVATKLAWNTTLDAAPWPQNLACAVRVSFMYSSVSVTSARFAILGKLRIFFFNFSLGDC